MTHEEEPEETLAYEQESPQGVQEPDFDNKDEEDYDIQKSDNSITVETTTVSQTLYSKKPFDDVREGFLDEPVIDYDKEFQAVPEKNVEQVVKPEIIQHFSAISPEALEREIKAESPESLAESPEQLMKEIKSESPETLETEIKAESPEPLMTHIKAESPEPLETEFKAASPEPLETVTREESPEQFTTEIKAESPEPLETEIKAESPEPLMTHIKAESPEPLEAEIKAASPEPLETVTREESPEQFTTEIKAESPEPLETEIKAGSPEHLETVLKAESPESLKAKVPVAFPEGIEPHTEHVETHIRSPDRDVIVAGKDFPSPDEPHETVDYKHEETQQYTMPEFSTTVDEGSHTVTTTKITTVHKTVTHSTKQQAFGAELPILAPILAQMKSEQREEKPMEYYEETRYTEPVVHVEPEPVIQIETAPVVSIEQTVVTMDDTTDDHEITHAMTVDDDDSLMAPQIHIQSATPIQRSPEDQDESCLPSGFTPITGDEIEIGDEITENEEEVEDYSSEALVAESVISTHARIRLTSSLEAQPGSPSPSDLGLEEQKQDEEPEEDRPLSPTDYVLEADTPMSMSLEAESMARSMEGDTVDEGRISSDTSQQIFIEQTIEAAKEKQDSVDITPNDLERPPSPTDYTLVLDGSLATEPEGNPALT